MRTRMFQRDGFLVSDTMMRAGEQKKFIFSKNISREVLPSCAFYAEGHMTFTKDGTVIATRPPGTFTLDRDANIEAGEYILTADEDGSRCFCIESDEKYMAQKWVGQKTDPGFELQPNQKLLICMGYVRATNGVLRTTSYHKPRDFLVAGPGPLVVESLDPTSMGVLLWR